MSSNPTNPLAEVSFETGGVPTLYCNHANPSVSFNDIRVYLSEVTPRKIAALVPAKPVSLPPEVNPRLCVVFSPEFAKGLAESLLKAVEKYEELFGPLRPQPDQAELTKKLSPQQG
jgi:hypothetical protein